MRELKFRCWDNERQRWLHDSDVYNELVEQARWNPERGERFSLEQFTGLKDSKGVDIYEGDIVDNIVIWGDEFGSSPVIFKDGCFGLDVLGSGHRRYEPCLYEADSRYITVIGNIHENLIDEARDKC